MGRGPEAGGVGVRGRAGVLAERPPGPSLEAVGAEGVLHGRVGEQRVGVAQHVQSVQGEGLDFQILLQPQSRRVHLEAGDAGQRRGDLLGDAGGRIPWETAGGGDKRGVQHPLSDVPLPRG